MGKSSTLGAWGEEKALEFLVQKGFRLVERNYHSRYGEIDLIVEDDQFLVFAEVKLRKSCRYGTPAEAVTPKKQERLRNTALLYLQAHPTQKQPRFDVVALYAKDGADTHPLPVQHIENAF
jgi:putative endonuclease